MPDAQVQPASNKRQRKNEPAQKGDGAVNELDTSKPSALFEPKQRHWTLSMAVPGSMIQNTDLFLQKNFLASSIARAAAVFCVDEIIVYDDNPSHIAPSLLQLQKKNHKKSKAELQALVDPHDEGYHNPDQFLFHLLSYLECPPFLRVPLMEKHPNLDKAGMLPPMDIPHHMKAYDWHQYREGMVVDAKEVEAYYNDSSTASKSKKNKNRNKDSSKTEEADEETFSYVDCGLSHPVKARTPVPAPIKSRVTVKFAAASDPPPSWPNLSREETEMLEVDIVAPEAPREEGGFYWGYNVRRAQSISAIYTESPFDGGYDCTIGTSERGVPLTSLIPTATSTSTPTTSQLPSQSQAAPATHLPTAFRHILVVFGGREGIEPAVASDPDLARHGLTKETAHQVFDFWVNLVPGQGSRTIRTEEAVWVGLMGLRAYLDALDHVGAVGDDDDDDDDDASVIG
ncbi:DUF171-domain-containing protein [Melanomma pulvis-pyrius CBS 109.77]|uniref:DUF171-domain-containing protein n=1 Tax=Melanomma pulvis-pyrius CBS 109.77 TaxID=1314802 RepID=A0A6A6WWZ8_9PLEO|nr:DUF171-domain-containing protein [Melanomma pulvis-pyrius CBS 109.77]